MADDDKVREQTQWGVEVPSIRLLIIRRFVDEADQLPRGTIRVFVSILWSRIRSRELYITPYTCCKHVCTSSPGFRFFQKKDVSSQTLYISCQANFISLNYKWCLSLEKSLWICDWSSSVSYHTLGSPLCWSEARINWKWLKSAMQRQATQSTQLRTRVLP